MKGGSADRSGGSSRRTLLGRLASAGASLGMGVGMVAAYGTLAAFMGRFLYPARSARRGWLYVKDLASFATGDSIVYRLPSGAPVNISRRGGPDSAESFAALSSTCPHLGCQVHWEPQNNRFFCPCHNGVFTPEGKGIGGPPGDAGLDLIPYPLKVEGGLLYIEVPFDQLALGRGRVESSVEAGRGSSSPGPPRGLSSTAPPGPGHDPCLYCRASEPRPEGRSS